MDKASATFKAGAPCARRAALPVLALTLVLPAAARAAAVRAAVFPFELDDTSLTGAAEGPRPADAARLARLDAQLRAALAGSGRYRLVDTAPVAPALAARSLRGCDACAAALARRLGAQVSVNGWVQKVSELILNINLVVRDADSGRMLRAGSVDIRGNTDESWTRGLAWLLRHRILNDAGATP
jgi:hypothetical protein